MNSNTRLAALLQACRSSFWMVFFFSFVMNVLMLGMSMYSLQVLDRVLSSASVETLVMLSVIMVVIFVVISLLNALRTFVCLNINRYLDKRLSSILLIESVQMKNSTIGSQHLRDLATIKAFIASPSFGQLLDAPWACIYMGVIFLIHPIPGFIILGSAVLLFMLAFLNEYLSKKPLMQANEAQVTSMTAVEELTRNAELITAMGMGHTMIQNWQLLNQESVNLSDQGAVVTTVVASITKGIRLTIQMLSMAVGAFLVIQQRMSAGGIIAISILSGKALAPFDAAMGMWKSVIGARKSYQRIQSVLEKTDQTIPKMALPNPMGRLSVEKVIYAIQDQLLIRGVNIHIPAGSALAILGQNGAGKTTLMRLLLGVLEPTKGTIRIDGSDIQNWDPQHLGRFLGYLPQDIELFSGTVQDNIARMNKDADPEEVLKAAQFTDVHSMILKLPNGYNTQIGVGGKGLSAGQRQQIALARAFFGNPKVVALDEPNSNLDDQAELNLLRTLERAKQVGITCVVITHRPSILQMMDRILILQEGEAKALMTPEEFTEHSNQRSKPALSEGPAHV